jgi:Helix-hairpin-helix motif
MRNFRTAMVRGIAAVGIVSLAGFQPSASPLPAPVSILMPVTDTAGNVVDVAASDGTSYPVFRAATDTVLVRQVDHALQTSFAAEVLRLDRYARNLLLNDSAGASRPGLSEPAYLLLSREEGGFSRRGFWLEDSRGRRRLVLAGYLDLVVTGQSVASGNFEVIFSHEMGHQILRELVGVLPPRRSRNMHLSVAVTDVPTAFDEGYAEQFEPLVRDHTTNAQLCALSEGTTSTDLDGLWLSRRDAEMRVNGVKQNLFIHRKALPASALDTAGDRYTMYVDGETSMAFTDALKTGQEMMASEGVIATLFYRLVNDPILQGHRRDDGFYRRFEVDAQAAATISPYENANLKLFAALHRAAPAIAGGELPMVAFARSCATLFPDEARAVYTVILEVTRGATASRRLAAALERAGIDGRRGDLDTFRSASRGAFALLDSVIGRVTQGRLAVDAAVGPEIWLLNGDFRIASPLWSPTRTLALTLNLNTATETELMTIPTVDLATARKIVALRRATGSFHALDDLADIISRDVWQALVSMHAGMDSATGPASHPPASRPQAP